MTTITLEEAYYNSLLYTPAAGQASKTASQGTLYREHQWLYATDGYVILSTYMPYTTSDEFDNSRVIVGSSVTAHLKDPNNKIETVESDELFLYWRKVVDLLWKTVDEDSWNTKSMFEVSPARLARLARLRPTGQYPLSFAFEKEMLAFKYGPDTIGVFGLLKLSKLDLEELPEGSLWK